MTDSTNFPVSIGNVTFLDGKPSQDQLAAHVSGMLGDADLESAINIFSESLLQKGRPGKRSNVVIEYGPRITDWLLGGAFLRRVHWHGGNCRNQNLPMFEMHCYDRSGWCAEVSESVLLHVPFCGNDDGLSSLEMACLLSESPHPDQALVDWLQGFLDADRDFFVDDIAKQMPEALREHLGYYFRFHDRIASMWSGGNEREVLFRAGERSRYIERELF
ncbi:TPA: hypothetical protein L4559_003491 [Pseudomonas aeruginosa]|nr:hypothetical protein [Pseudomonas aeruginosa]